MESGQIEEEKQNILMRGKNPYFKPYLKAEDEVEEENGQVYDDLVMLDERSEGLPDDDPMLIDENGNEDVSESSSEEERKVDENEQLPEWTNVPQNWRPPLIGCLNIQLFQAFQKIFQFKLRQLRIIFSYFFMIKS